MPAKGTFTAASAARQGLIPAAPIAAVINRWAAENWWMDAHQEETSKNERGATERLAEFVGVHHDTISKVRFGRKEWIQFDIADKIVCFTFGPLAWLRDPDLAEVYTTFDLAHLDFNHPTCPEVREEFLELAGSMSQRHLAGLYGVSQSTVYRTLAKERVAA